MTCKLCQERGKNWNGSDPKCAFPNGLFSSDNWNCEIANRLRSRLCSVANSVYCADQWYATIKVSDCGPALALWISWYKSRGRTDAMWLLFEAGQPRLPTEAECLHIIEYLESKHG